MTTSAIAVEKLGSRLAISRYAVVADHSSATDVGWVDMQGFESFMVVTLATHLTGVGITAFTIVANTLLAGTGDEEIIKTHAVGSAPDAVNDSLVLEITADELNEIGRKAGYALRYVSAKITAANAADDHAMFYVRGFGQFPRTGLTADVVA